MKSTLIPTIAAHGLVLLSCLFTVKCAAAAVQARGPNRQPIPALAADGRETLADALSLRDYMQAVRHINGRIVSELLEFEVAAQGVNEARAIFEALFIATGTHEENSVKNTAEQQFSRDFQPQFDEYNERWDTAFESLLSTGAKVHVGYHLDDLTNNLQRLVNPAEKIDELRTLAGANVVQPLLKDGGRSATHAKIRIAEKDRDIAFQVFRREMMRILAEAGATYWDLYQAQERRDLCEESTAIAAKTLKIAREKAALGLLPQSDALEGEAGVGYRQSQEEEAGRDLMKAMGKVRSFLFRSAAEDRRLVEAGDEPDLETVGSDLGPHLRSALDSAPEYLIALNKAAREGIRLSFAKNQTYPQLDLKGSYGLNGLAGSTSASLDDAFTTNHVSWNVGFEFRLPLQGNQKARAEVAATDRRRQQAIVQIKTTEIELGNTLAEDIHAVLSTAKQVGVLEAIVEKRQQLLDIELERLEGGLTTSRNVLQRDEDLHRAADDCLRATVLHKKAVLVLAVAEGTLLKHFGVDIDPPRLQRAGL